MIDYKNIGFYPGNILLPQTEDMNKWSVVACDQYTSQPEYWARVREYTGAAPSTLNLILPEAELENADPGAVHAKMQEYMQNGLFKEYQNAMIYLHRTQNDGKIRQGLIGVLDLECYDYHKGSQTLCRATEGTVEDRLPPRIRVRKAAPMESPHIMVLIDDPQGTVIEDLRGKTGQLQEVYNFDLMEKGGHLQGWLIQGDECENRMRALSALAGDAENPLLYAMGDGNHSLATAKACYEQLKEAIGEKAMAHPARYCLVELVNLHSEALEFEPIHRIVAETDPDKLMVALREAGLEEGDNHAQKIEVVRNGIHTPYSFAKESSKLAVGSLQNALDRLVPQIGGSIDYIHGEDVVDELSQKEGSIGFILPNMEKEDLFPTVVTDGALPRKTFSMGHAHDKRFYLECRRIVEE
jgi:uncharacterized protein (DUF1015 family)